MAMQRVKHIDIAKALGIVMVITAHIPVSTDLTVDRIYSNYQDIITVFYVPMFFILSGIFTKEYEPVVSIRCFTESIWRSVKYLVGLLVVFYLLSVLLYYVNFDRLETELSVNVPLWFLITLIYDKVVYQILLNLRLPKLVNIAIVVITGFIGCWLGRNGHNFMYIGIAATSLPFFAAGHWFREYWLNEKFHWTTFVISLCVLVCVFVFFFVRNELWLNEINQNFILFYVGAFSGASLFIQLCKLIKWEWLLFFGANSIIPMCMHVPIMYSLRGQDVCLSMTHWLAVLLILFVLSYLSIYLFNNPLWDMTRFRLKYVRSEKSLD